MPRYALAGLTIVSDMAFPELPDAVGQDGMWSFELISGRTPRGFATPIHQATTDDGRVWLDIRREGEEYLLRFPGSADFIVTPSVRRIACLAAEDVAASTIRHLLLDQVVPHVLTMDGSLVLHASAIATPFGAVAFIGPSGAGKSSLAASFAFEGFPLLSDDFVLLTEHPGGFAAIPAYPGLRLWPDSVTHFSRGETQLRPVAGNTDKRRLDTGPQSESCERLPLVAVVLLAGDLPQDGPPFALGGMPGREGFLALFEQAFRMERLGRDRQAREFDRFARLAGSITLMRLDYRRDYDLLPGIRAEILEWVGRRAETGCG